MAEDKIARICWNTEGWRKPSGPHGKSRNKKAFEHRVGYGFEEWLLDTTKLIDGWHYAYLQPIGRHWKKYVDKIFNISLYSINNETKGHWWVGRILNVKVITEEESRRVWTIYKKNGWLEEMEEQLRAVNANVKNFRKVDPEDFAVIQYRLKSLQLEDIPREFSANDPAVPASYYILLNQKQNPKLRVDTKRFSFFPGHKKKNVAAKSTYQEQSSEVDLVQNSIQTNLFTQLAKEYGKENVGTEQDTGYGSHVDLVVRDSDKQYIFYEIKTSYSALLCIREALGQLMEYAFYPKANNAKKLVVVSPNQVTPEAKRYLQEIRDRFGIPLYYQRYDSDTQALKEIES